MKTKELSKILELSVAQRILIVQEIWDSILDSPDSIPLNNEDKEELEKRLVAYYNNPEAGTPWEKVKANLLANQ